MIDIKKTTVYFVEDSTALKDIFRRSFFSSKKIDIKFIDFEDILSRGKGIVKKKEKIIVDISRYSNYIQEIDSLKKIFLNNSSLLLLLINENQLLELKDDLFFSNRILFPHDLQQIKRKLGL